MKKIGNVLIIGDSYSTFEGYIPEGFSIYYKNPPCTYSDVTSVEQTWWHLLLSNTESKLILNSSYSGSTLCHTGYDGKDVKNTSFLGRLKKLIEEGFFASNSIDTAIIFGGTNDSWANSPVGKPTYTDWTDEEEYCALPAFCEILSLIKENAPDAEIIIVINSELKEDITEGMADVGSHYGAKVIRLSDIDKLEGHPTVKGMHQMYEQIEKGI